ncbi:MAG: DUF348 domain-containing protein [Anaerolineae bacterium]|nr:DUF348 domain-containing protein [Anaerolineae bacterium]
MTPQERSAPARKPRRRWTRAVLIAASAALIAGGALAADRLTRKSVTLDVGGSIQHLHTHADTVGEALQDAGIALDPEDLVHPLPQSALRDGMTITVRKAHAVALQVDGTLRQVRTQAVHPLDVLEEQAIPLGEYDVVQVNGQPYLAQQLEQIGWETPAATIRVVRSVTLKLVEGETTQVLHTTQADVGRALDAAGVTLYLADRIVPGPSTPVADGLIIAIERSVPLTVIADGQTLATRALGPTVGDALAQVGVAPADLDTTIPPLETPLTAGMTIRVVRVSEDLTTQDEPIPFTTITRLDSTLDAGQERVIQEGADGLRRLQIRERSEDGRVMGRETVAEWIVATPIPRIVAQGDSAP